MSRALLIIAAGAGVIAIGAAAYWLTRPADVAAPAAAVVPSEAVTAPAAAPPAAAPARATRSAPTAPPAAAPPPAVPPVEAEPTTGTLRIESDVPDTSVFLDRVYLGTAPVTAENVRPGPHHLNLSAPGYEGISEPIDVKAGRQTIAIRFKEIRLDVAVEVRHKHGVGSCAGTLRATPQGITFDTTNENDRFTAKLTDLDTFEFDYLGNNLRVKARGGRTFNFADAAGKADALYAFHRDTEKARQRLLAGGG